MDGTFGQLVARRRAELRLTLRECAVRADIDAGDLSKMERGKVSPPQSSAVVERLVAALELSGTTDGQAMLDTAALENGRLPVDLAGNPAVVSALPLLLRTFDNRQLDEQRMQRLLEKIREA